MVAKSCERAIILQGVGSHDDRPETNWTIHKLAEVAGMSRSSLPSIFREVVKSRR